MPFPESFATARLRAERLTADHYNDVRAMDGDAAYMALLGGTRTEGETGAYMERNLKHWADYGFGLVYERDVDHEGVPHLPYRSPGHFEVS